VEPPVRVRPAARSSASLPRLVPRLGRLLGAPQHPRAQGALPAKVGSSERSYMRVGGYRVGATVRVSHMDVTPRQA
jgi:hypothetical protein